MSNDELGDLRAEQVERIKQRDSFVNFAIVSIGIMVSASFAGDGARPEILLAVPWVTLAFGWTFVLNDIKVVRLSAYFQYVDRKASSFGWEDWRRQSRPIWLELPLVGALVQVLVFIVPGLAAPFAYMAIRPSDALAPWEIVCLGIGTVLNGCLLFAIWAAGRLRQSLRS